MSGVKVGCLDVWTPRIRDEVRRCAPAEFSLAFADSYDPDEQARLVSESDLVLTGWAAVSAGMIAAAPRLRMIQKWGIGVERIDLAEAARRGIVVAITTGGNASVVAEHALMLVLAVYRRLSLVDRSTHEGGWLFAEMRERCFQLRGKTVGLVGFGNIGRMVARKLAGFDVTIVYTDPVRPSPDTERDLRASFVPLDELLGRSDVVSLHCPGGDANRHLMDAAAFGRMKPGAIFVNVARGDLVDETALLDALVSGRLMGAGLDVFEPEPPAAGNPLLALDQVVLTPHTAGSVFDNVENVARHAFGNMQRFLRGEPIAPADLVTAAP